MRIFVTGATGFIGQHLVARLLLEDVELVCLVRPDESQAARAHLKSQRVTIVDGDILWERERLAELMRGCTHVVHLAGLYSFFSPFQALYQINVLGAQGVMDAALICGLRAVHVSSCTAFGRQAGEFDELAPPGPALSDYGYSKALGDERVRALRDSGLRASILYPASVLGAGDDKASGRYLQAVAEPTWWRGGTGMPMLPLAHRRMTWVHVLDVVDAIWGALCLSEAVGRDYLVGGGIHDLGEIHDMVARARLGRQTHHKWNFPFDWLLMAVASIIEPVGRAFKIEPPWGLTRDQIRTLLHGIKFRGERAQRELLDGRPYRSIEEAIREFFAE